MTNEDLEDWRRFELNTVCQIEDKQKQNFLSLKIDSSFDKKKWLFVSKNKSNFKWTYLEWDFILDYNRILSNDLEKINIKLHKFIPSIKECKGELNNDFYFETEKKLVAIKLNPYVLPDLFGLDGTIFTISIGGSFFVESRFSWWENLPKEWNELDDILMNLNKNLEIAQKVLENEFSS